MKIRVFLTILLLYLSSVIYSKEYTIQVGVASDSAQAEIVRAKILEATAESVYITRDSTSYKIQVGSFPSPESAKAVQASLQEKGYTGFIVPITLKKPISTTIPAEQTPKPKVYKKTSKASYPLKITKKYTIQVGVCSDSTQAEIVKTKIQARLIAELTTSPLYITRDSSFYKIQVGYFSSPESAKASATELRQKGYAGFVVEAKFEPAPEKLEGKIGEPSSKFGIQLRTCTNKNEADSVLKEYETIHHIPVYILFIPPDYKIMTGKFETQAEAEETRVLLEKAGHYNTFLVPLKKHLAELTIPPESRKLSGIADSLQQKTKPDTIPPVQPKPSIITKGFYVEVEAFKEKESAEQLQKKLQSEFSKQTYILEKPPYYKVIFVDFGSVDDAMEMVSILQNSGYEGALLVFGKPDG